MSLLRMAEATGWVSLMPAAEEVEAAGHHISVPKVLPSIFVSEVPDQVSVLSHGYRADMKALLKSFNQQIGSPPIEHPEFYSLDPSISSDFLGNSQSLFDSWITQEIYSAYHDGATYLLTPTSRYTWVGETAGTRLVLAWKWNTNSLSLVCVFKAPPGFGKRVDLNLPRYKLVVFPNMRLLQHVRPKAFQEKLQRLQQRKSIPDTFVDISSSSSESHR